jgi:hypothetical protein
LKPTDRFITAVAFILIGPGIGALWLWCWSLGDQLLDGDPGALALESLPLMLGVGYVAGFLPALVTGITFASLPADWQRVIVSLPIGTTVTWVLWQLLGLVMQSPHTPALSLFMIVSAGGLAAAVSAYSARVVLDLLGRHYIRTAGLGGRRDLERVDGGDE